MLFMLPNSTESRKKVARRDLEQCYRPSCDEDVGKNEFTLLWFIGQASLEEIFGLIGVS